MIRFERQGTMDLRNCVSSPDELFDFEYDFYSEDEEIKKNFESLFYQHYYFYEIGQETYARFKYMLRTNLNLKMPYYKQLYQSEIEAYEIGWLNQKDMIDTFERELEGTVDQTTESKDISKSTNKSKSDNFFSDTPSSKVDDIENYMSNATRDKMDSEGNLDNTSSAKGNTKNKTIERTTYHSKGQIGIQTVAQPVQWWREQMINLNEIIIEDMRELFMLLY